MSRAYIRSLVTSYANALADVDVIDKDAALEALRQWIPLVLPGEHGVELLAALNENDIGAILTNSGEDEDNPFYSPTDDLNIIKTQILAYIGNLLLWSAK